MNEIVASEITTAISGAQNPDIDIFKFSETDRLPWENIAGDSLKEGNDIYRFSENDVLPWEETREYSSTYEERIKHTPIEISDRGQWTGERGESKYIPTDVEIEKILAKDDLDGIEYSSGIDRRLPRTGGGWDGEPGDSVWKPDRDKTPENSRTNPDGQTWGEILDEYEIDGIPFKDDEPDFSEVSKGMVEVDDFSDDRDDNFDAADEKLAEQRGCTKEEVRQWRKEHGYTWHECGDMKTMQKVPTKVHGNIPHDGGISAKKKEEHNNG